MNINLYNYMSIKIIAWNVNGIRSLMKNDNLYNLIETEKPNIICFGETKLTCPILGVQTELKEKISGYKYRYFSQCLIRGGYSGTAIFCKKKPLVVSYGINNSELDNEGRVITLEYEKFFLVHVYTPNSGQSLQRLDYRVKKWDIEFYKYIKNLQKNKNIIICGDLNIANEDIDIHSPKNNKRTAGFTDEERISFKKYINELKLIDTYRYINPKKIEYSYWSYRFKSRSKNNGWRIDYFLVSENLKTNIKKAKILTEIMGSDHAPIKLSIKF
jgi:exodeoxyribonuclease III